ncbi:DEAD/DEAH box helicase [Candidatus Bathyarchaeota archaeon]|nr:DEAD/DEAH box helicase [Candidatus Bathyarchaeota archaeon]
MNFEHLEISEKIKKAINDLGYVEMFPIQEKSIPLLLQGKNIIGQAKTGTGKTASFGIPMVEKLKNVENKTHALVLAPTRELAQQITDDLNNYAKYTKVKAISVYGGVSIDKQINELRRNPSIIVGTPGRIIDHIKRGTLYLKEIKVLVLDEADNMLDMGFIDDIEYILKQTPRKKQISLWSATIDERTMRISNRYMPDAEFVNVSRDELGVTDIEQYYILVPPYEKDETLKRLIDFYEIERCIIFCRMKVTVDELQNTLNQSGFSVEAMHGDYTQARRQQVLDGFREEKFSLMIATELAARGLDIEDVPWIINYDIPTDPNMYFHRVGRTARAGKSGNAITIVTPEEEMELERIKAMTKIPITKITLPPLFLF